MQYSLRGLTTPLAISTYTNYRALPDEVRPALPSATDLAALATALTGAGHTAEQSLGGVRTDADTAQVGRVALAAGVPLTELRPADGAGLEEMFLELTKDNAREEVAA